MKFYVIEITTYMDGTAESKGMYAYQTLDEAVASFHSKMGGWMKNANCASELVMVVDSNGTCHKNERWERAVSE